MPSEDDNATDSPPVRGGIDRPGWLTPRDRKYLLGTEPYDDPAQERNARQRLRTRIRNGLLDFRILLRELEPRDRKQVFTALNQNDPFTDDETIREDEVSSLIYAIGFLAVGAHESNLPFEQLVELGVLAADWYDDETPFALEDVSVTIDTESTTDLGYIAEKIAADDPLHNFEYALLKRLYVGDIDRLYELTADVEFSRDELHGREQPLSRGRSVLYVLRGLPFQDDDGVPAYDEVLHDDVLREFAVDEGANV